jgi:high-affinity Fe2+/Pb2+ permease
MSTPRSEQIVLTMGLDGLMRTSLQVKQVKQVKQEKIVHLEEAARHFKVSHHALSTVPPHTDILVSYLLAHD